MSDNSRNKIGNPLTDAAKSGVIGGTERPTITSKTTALSPQQKRRSEDEEQGEKNKEPERVKRTFMLTPERAKWLKVQAALEEKDMSDILDEALATYQQLHPQQRL